VVLLIIGRKYLGAYFFLGQVALWAVVILAVLSAVDYFLKFSRRLAWWAARRPDRSERGREPAARTLGRHLRHTLLTGLLVLLPLFITVWLLTILFRMVDGVITPWVRRAFLLTGVPLFEEPAFLQYITPAIGLFTTLLLIYVAGLLSANLFRRETAGGLRQAHAPDPGRPRGLRREQAAHGRPEPQGKEKLHPGRPGGVSAQGGLHDRLRDPRRDPGAVPWAAPSP